MSTALSLSHIMEQHLRRACKIIKQRYVILIYIHLQNAQTSAHKTKTIISFLFLFQC